MTIPHGSEKGSTTAGAAVTNLRVSGLPALGKRSAAATRGVAAALAEQRLARAEKERLRVEVSFGEVGEA
jgi:hypothetical protein